MVTVNKTLFFFAWRIQVLKLFSMHRFFKAVPCTSQAQNSKGFQKSDWFLLHDWAQQNQQSGMCTYHASTWQTKLKSHTVNLWHLFWDSCILHKICHSFYFLIMVAYLLKHILTRGPSVLYRSPECIGYAELQQTWKIHDYMPYKLSPMQKHFRKQIWLCHKNGHGQPSSIIWTNLVV